MKAPKPITPETPYSQIKHLLEDSDNWLDHFPDAEGETLRMLALAAALGDERNRRHPEDPTFATEEVVILLEHYLLQRALHTLLEEGRIVVVGYDEHGDPIYARSE